MRGGDLNSQEHGAGCQTFANVEVQEGEFAHGELSGYGRYRYPTGSVHIGPFVAGKRISTVDIAAARKPRSAMLRITLANGAMICSTVGALRSAIT